MALSSSTTCRFIPAHSHPCVALSSAQVKSEWINRSLAVNAFPANGDNPLNFVSHSRGSLHNNPSVSEGEVPTNNPSVSEGEVPTNNPSVSEGETDEPNPPNEPTAAANKEVADEPINQNAEPAAKSPAAHQSPNIQNAKSTSGVVPTPREAA